MAPRSAEYTIVSGSAIQVKARNLPKYCCGVQGWICGLSAISGFLFGYDLCVMVVALPLIQQEFALSTMSAETIVSTLMLGAVIGSLVGGVVADWIGRKRANLITAALFLTGSLFMTLAGSLYTMLVGRFIAGLAVGSSGPCVSTYVAEISQPKNRGVLVTISEIMVCFGCLVSVVVSASLEDSENSWRKMLGMTLIPPLIQLLGMPFLPESPRWLISKHRTKEASVALKRLLYTDEASHDIIQAHLDTGKFHKSFFHTISELMTDKLTQKRVVFCVAIAVCQILTAANAVLYYSSYILDELQSGNRHPVSPISKEIWVGIAKLAGVSTAVAVVDRVGRRPLLIIGTTMITINHFVFSVCFLSLSSAHSEYVQAIGELNLYVLIYAWNLSWAPLMWVVCSELLPDEFRSIGMGLTFGTFWLGSALVNQTLLSIIHAFGAVNAFLLYSTLTAGSLAFVLFKVPETKGLTFEEITMLFNEQVVHVPIDDNANRAA